MASMASMGSLIRELRVARGWSQGQLAEALCEVSGRPTITREEVSRWERGVRVPGPFWLPHLASTLQTPVAVLEIERVKRRSFLRMAALAPIAGMAPQVAEDLVASIAGGDTAPLGQVQTSHRTDLAISALASRDRVSLLHLARWMDDGDSEILRVNATGILAKSQDSEMLDAVSLTLGRDDGARKRYVSAVTSRCGSSVSALSKEILNPHDSGARWVSAFLLGRDGGPAATRALQNALRREPVRENVRAIGLILNGVDPCT